MATAEYQGPIESGYEPGVADFSPSPEHDLDPVIVIGGLLTGDETILVYNRMLDDPQSPLTPAERLISPPYRGLAPFDEMNGLVKEAVMARAEQLQRPVALGGHSEGGPLAIEAGLNLPSGVVSSVTTWGAPNFGVTRLTPGGHLLKHTVGRIAKGTGDIMADSDYMTGLREAVATRWSEDVAVHLLATPFDDLVSTQDALRIKLPPGQRANRKVMMPSNPILRAALRHVYHFSSDVRELRTRLPVNHYLMVRHKEVVDHHREIRGQEDGAAGLVAAAQMPTRPHLVVV